MGVKSLGCEKSTAHESPIQSWNLMGPWVVFASKSGAVSLMESPIGFVCLPAWVPTRPAYYEPSLRASENRCSGVGPKVVVQLDVEGAHRHCEHFVGTDRKDHV